MTDERCPGDENPWEKHLRENPPAPIDPDDIDPFTGSPYRCGEGT